MGITEKEKIQKVINIILNGEMVEDEKFYIRNPALKELIELFNLTMDDDVYKLDSKLVEIIKNYSNTFSLYGISVSDKNDKYPAYKGKIIFYQDSHFT